MDMDIETTNDATMLDHLKAMKDHFEGRLNDAQMMYMETLSAQTLNEKEAFEATFTNPLHRDLALQFVAATGLNIAQLALFNVPTSGIIRSLELLLAQAKVTEEQAKMLASLSTAAALPARAS